MFYKRIVKGTVLILLFIMTLTGCGSSSDVSQSSKSETAGSSEESTITSDENAKGTRNNPYIIGQDTITIEGCANFDTESTCKWTISNLDIYYVKAIYGDGKVGDLMFDISLDSAPDDNNSYKPDDYIKVTAVTDNMQESGSLGINSIDVDDSGIPTDYQSYSPVSLFSGGKIENVGVIPSNTDPYDDSNEDVTMKYYCFYYFTPEEVMDDYWQSKMSDPIWVAEK